MWLSKDIRLYAPHSLVSPFFLQRDTTILYYQSFRYFVCSHAALKSLWATKYRRLPGLYCFCCDVIWSCIFVQWVLFRASSIPLITMGRSVLLVIFFVCVSFPLSPAGFSNSSKYPFFPFLNVIFACDNKSICVIDCMYRIKGVISWHHWIESCSGTPKEATKLKRNVYIMRNG